MDPKQLPVWSAMPALLEAVRKQRNLVLVAPPGSGKTTQVPRALLSSGAVAGKVLVVQPRRVACRTVAARVAEEDRTPLGGRIGYTVRFEDVSSSETRLLFVTDGVLMRFLERDPDLSDVGAVVFDEFHERRAASDVALGLLKAAGRRRSSLRLLVMSATIEAEDVSRYLQAEVFRAEGRMYPVEVEHVAMEDDHDAVVRSVPRIVVGLLRKSAEGDILVFLSGKEEIRRVHQALAALDLGGTTVFPLHGEMSREAQSAVFLPAPGRKVVLATNVAETSLTIPGIRTVVDTGFERRSEFSAAFGIDRLELVRISLASAEQRKGRAGREAPGRCLRLWGEDVHRALFPSAPVEMRRTDLSSVVLLLKSVGILDARAFDFLDYPGTARIEAAVQQLAALGAIGEDGHLTQVGWKMLRLPLPPRYARMVVEAQRAGCLKEVAGVAALMAGRPIFALAPNGPAKTGIRPPRRPDDAFSLVSLFREGLEADMSPEWYDAEGLNGSAVEEARHLWRKILRISDEQGAVRSLRDGRMDAVGRCLLAGLPDRIAADGGRGYRLPSGLACKLPPRMAAGRRPVAALEIRTVVDRRDPSRNSAALGLAFPADVATIRQVLGHCLEEVEIPVAWDAARRALAVRAELRVLGLPVEAAEREVDLVDALRILEEQRRRARRNGWHLVVISPGIGKRSTVQWEGRTIPVESERSGPHWASVAPGTVPRIRIQEPHVDPPAPRGDSGFLEPLRERLARTSSAVGRLLALKK